MTDTELFILMYTMVLQARPIAKQEAWKKRGLLRLTHRGTLFDYWKKQLEKYPDKTLEIFERSKTIYLKHNSSLPPEKTIEEIRSKIERSKSSYIPTPKYRNEWPLILKPLLLFAKPEDKGLGDIIAHKIGPIGGDAFKVWFLETFGKECGCEARQEKWNALYPI